ncbi:MAG: hypothetical protein JRH20_14655 [Deltaproteobacteria bacterium]|nr:hypothetical protein [Deltaproteobacteria bacterium]
MVSLLLVACGDDSTELTLDSGPDVGVSLDALTESGALHDGSSQVVGDAKVDGSGLREDAALATDFGSTDAASTLVDATMMPDFGVTTYPGTCRRAPKVTLVGGQATIEDDTSKYEDEFSDLVCGGGAYDELDGAQAYYRFDGKKDHWYRLSITPTFSAVLYVFTNSRCTEASIEADCASEGATGDLSSTTYSNLPRSFYFKAPQDGEIYVAVDSESSYADGPFTLKIQEISAPINATCANAAPLAFIDGKAITRGDIALAFSPDEFSGVGCGSSSYNHFDGPQVYYSFEATKGEAYKISLRPTAASSLYFYIFGSTCTQAAINADCSSEGVSGDVMTSSVSSPKVSTLIFVPAQSGSITIAVDTRIDSAGGAFTLSVEDYAMAPNLECTSAAPVTFTHGKATIEGDTLAMRNEYADNISCGGYSEFDGEQAYFEINAQAGKYYYFDVTTSYTSGYLYGFRKTSCGGIADINADCGSDGERGFRVSSSTTGKQFIFKPVVPGSYVFAVDSSAPGYAGPFTLSIEEHDAPLNDTCAAATPLVFSGGTATVLSSNKGATSEFGDTVKCGNTIAYDGPQVYYSFEAKADYGYRVTLKPTYGGYMYLFQQSACSSAASINADCESAGATGFTSGYVGANDSKAVLFRPSSPGTYVIGIDSSDMGNFGDFVLRVDEMTPPPNQLCSEASALTFVDGKVNVKGSTSLALNELPVACGEPEYFDGPQVYYNFNAEAGKTYWFRFKPSFDAAYLYIFGDSCVAPDINAACSSEGQTGELIGPVSQGSETFYFKPTTAGITTIGVDSNLSKDADELGDFELEIEAFDVPANGSCTSAKALTFVDNVASVSGYTAGATNEFAGAISCGGSAHLDGPQVYYKAALQAGIKYIVRANADFDAELYYFRDAANCQAAGIEADCGGSDANLGEHVSLPSGQAKVTTFVPPVDGTYIFAMDSLTATELGRYELSISAFIVPTVTAPFNFDFEASSAGLAPTGDWEHGEVSFVGDNCDSYLAPRPPTGGLGHDSQQTGMWATVLNNCHANAANDDGYGGGCSVGDPTDDSILAFSVTIPSTHTKATLVLWHWLDGSTSYDHPAVFVDNAAVLTICPTTDDPKWEKLEVDLTAHIGKTTLVELHWVATAGSNRAGWYIDEVGVEVQ